MGMITDFVNRNNDGFLSNITGKAAGLVDQVQAQNAAKRAQQAYMDAKSAYMENPTDLDARDALYAAGDAIGKFDQTKTMVESLDTQRQTNLLQRTGEVYSALYSGNLELAKQKLEDQASAEDAEGDYDEAKIFRQQIVNIEEGRTKEIMALYGGNMGLIPGGKEAMENVHAINKDKREELASEAVLLNAANNWEWASNEAKANAMEFADGFMSETARELIGISAVAGTNFPLMTPAQQATLLTTLRKEWTKDTTPFRAAETTKDKMDVSLSQDTSQGDVGALFLFMKMLDENSVVRESEFKTASNMGSILDSLKNTMQGWQTGQRLQPGQKENLRKLTTAFAEQMAEKQKPFDERMTRVAGNYKIPVDLIMFDDLSEGEPPTGDVPETADLPDDFNVSADKVTTVDGETPAVVEETSASLANAKYDSETKGSGGLTQDQRYRAWLIKMNPDAQKEILTWSTADLVAKYINGTRTFDNKEKVEAAKLQKLTDEKYSEAEDL